MYRTALAAATALLFTTSLAEANSLDAINAMACGTDAPHPSQVSSSIGATYSRAQSKPRLDKGTDEQFHAMVKLKMIYQHDGFAEIEHCGGTLIDSRYVMTAAHCVFVPEGQKHWQHIEVMVGETKIGGEYSIKRKAREAVCHAGHDEYLANDIALVKLDEPMPADIRPAKIDEYRRPTVRPGAIAIAAGWPVTGPRAGEKHLRKTPLSVTDVEWPGFITVTSPFGRAEGVCQGESGGPLLSSVNGRESVAGVLSGIEPGTNDAFGEPCMKAGYDMYYTPIAAYREWIEGVMDICSDDPDECRGKGSPGFFLSEGSSSWNNFPASKRFESEE